MSSQKKSKAPAATGAEINSYVRYRARLVELLDLWNLMIAADKDASGELKPRLQTLNLVTTTWLASILDQRGLNVLPLWKRLFPRLVEDIRAFERKHRLKIKEIEEFRDKTGAHADSLEEQNRVRNAASQGLGGFMDDFLTMATKAAREEGTLPELESEIRDHGLPPGDFSPGEGSG